MRFAARFFLPLLLAFAALGAAAAMPNFGELEQKLRIRPEQKQQYDLAVGATKRALLAVGLIALQLKERLAAELMKPDPDFAALLRSHQEILEQSRPQFKEAGEAWKKLYDQLDPEQVEIAKSFVRENLNRFIQ
ncbi:MAG TPA: hypothetical protein VII36_08810, partial [Usitatibacter sp.]